MISPLPMPNTELQFDLTPDDQALFLADVEAAAAAVERRAAKREPEPAAPADRRAKKGGRRTSDRKAVAPADSQATHRFTVVIEEGPWAAVRALQVLMALGEHGRIVER